LQVSVRKRATNYRAPLRKMTCQDKASFASSPPCKTWDRNIRQMCIWIITKLKKMVQNSTLYSSETSPTQPIPDGHWASFKHQKLLTQNLVLVKPCLVHATSAEKSKTSCKPPKNGEIALLFTTNSLMCSKYVSQKRNEAIDNNQWYNMLLNFIL